MRDAEVKHLSYLWGFAGELDVSTPFDALLKSFVRKQKYYKTSVEDFAIVHPKNIRWCGEGCLLHMPC